MQNGLHARNHLSLLCKIESIRGRVVCCNFAVHGKLARVCCSKWDFKKYRIQTQRVSSAKKTNVSTTTALCHVQIVIAWSMLLPSAVPQKANGPF